MTLIIAAANQKGDVGKTAAPVDPAARAADLIANGPQPALEAEFLDDAALSVACGYSSTHPEVAALATATALAIEAI